MSEIASAFITLVPSMKGFGSSLNSQVAGETRAAGSTIGRSFGRMFVLGAGVIAAAGIGNLLKGSIEEAREAQKVGAATAAIIKATGGAANLTADQIGRLADSLSRKIGVDDEVIAAGANVLATFKLVREEAGKGNDVFTRATKAGADLAATGFGSIESNAKTLGKALQDPLKGITALTRAGVTFTDAQKEQIRGFVESGDLLKAQKVILGEVEGQVGGVAAATATAGEKASVAFGNIKESIGTLLLPVIDSLANAFTNTIAPAIQGFISNLQAGQGVAGQFGAFIRDTYVPYLRAIGEIFTTYVVPALKTFASFVLTNVVPAVRDVLVAAFERARKAISDNRPQLEQLATGLKKLGAFILTEVVPKVMDLASRALPFLIGVVSAGVDIFNAVRGAVGKAVDAFNNVKDAIKKVIEVGGNVIDTFGDVKDKVGAAAGLIRDAVKGAFDDIALAIGNVIEKVVSLIEKIKSIPTPNLPDLPNPFGRVSTPAGLIAPTSIGAGDIYTSSRGGGTGGDAALIREVKALRGDVQRQGRDFALALDNVGARAMSRRRV